MVESKDPKLNIMVGAASIVLKIAATGNVAQLLALGLVSGVLIICWNKTRANKNL